MVEGGWTRKGLVLDPQANAVADEVLASRRAVEPAITRRMADIKATLGGVLVGLKYRLKGEDRFKEKLAKMALDEPDIAVGEHAREIHDGIRYTIAFHSRRYTSCIAETFRRLEEDGYKKVVVKNSWGSDGYKGINTRWRHSATGQMFELQFHTTASWRAKQRTHDAYEELNDPRVQGAEADLLEEQVRSVMSKVPQPVDWKKIKDFDGRGGTDG